MQFPSTQRYEIRGVLGRGGAGVVYEAHDTQSQALVALKTIEKLDGESLYRLKREFRLLADFQHKNLVRLGELSCEGERWFFTMQLVRGRHFVDYVRSAEPKVSQRPAAGSGGSLPAPPGFTFDDVRLRSALVQVVQALSALHEAGYLHRDVKPSNILVTDDGQVVLLDFGLSQLIQQPQTVGDSLGTPAYMAPEAVTGDEVLGPASDWYSLGAMLYQALTGKLPFGGSNYAIMEAKLLRAPPSPRFLAPEAPADLLALCEDLLQVDPEKRPSASEILRRIGERPATEADLYGWTHSEADAPFVGRTSELSALGAALSAVRDGQARNVVVQGEPGVGKSTAVKRFLSTLGSGLLVLSGRCYEQENVPFKGVDSIVDALTDHLCSLPDDDVNLLLEGGVRYLSVLFPVLTRVDAVRRVVPEGGQVFSEGAVRELATGELERLLDALARRDRLVMFIDDLQWADSDGLELLRRILLRPARAPGLFIATLRPVADPPAGLAELLAASERIVFGALSEAESHALWNSLGPVGVDVDPAVRESAVREAAGHPLFLGELVLALRDGRRRQDRQLRLQDVLWERVTARDALERRFLEMLAVAGAPTAYEVIARAAGLSVGECLTRLAGLKAAQLVRISRRGDERAVELYHDRLREAITEQLAAREDRSQREDHLRLGSALRDSTPKEILSQRVYAIVHHLGVARDLLATPKERRELAELYLLASRTARLETAFAKARDHARAGLDLLTDAGWSETHALTLELTFQLMATHYMTGDAEQARACFDTALSQLTEIPQRVRLYASRVWLETAHGHFGAALAAGREILEELGTPLPTHATVRHVLAQFAEYKLRQGRRSLDDLIELPTLQSPRLEGALEVLASIAAAAYLTDDMLHGWIRLRIVNLSLKHGVSKVSSVGFAGLGLFLAGAFDKYTEAAASLRLALKLNQRFQNDALAPELLFLDGHYVSPWTEPFAQGVGQLRLASELAAQQGNTAIEGYAAAAFALTSYQEGSALVDLQQLSERAAAVATHRGMGDMAAVGQTLREYAAILRGLSQDDPNRAPASGKQGVAPWIHNQCAAELAFFTDDLERAERFAREASKRAPLGVPTTIELLLLNILIAARRYEDAPLPERPRLVWAMVKQLRKLRSCAQSCPENFESYYLIGLGELLRVGGRSRNADREFARAAESARAQGSLKREALALALGARNAAQQGDASRARALQERADDAYRRWGAVIKVRQDALPSDTRSAA
jgi:predicted ATPase/tRNA A-37 threonylcarbamoyl transferase component Bud32